MSNIIAYVKQSLTKCLTNHLTKGLLTKPFPFVKQSLTNVKQILDSVKQLLDNVKHRGKGVKQMTKAIGYIRVSTEGQANEGVSLDAQSAKIRAYCELNDLELVEIVCDAGKSAKNTDRDGLQQCLTMLSNNEASALVVYKLDRLSRKVLDALNLISEIESYGASLHSIVEKLDTQSALGKFFVNMTAALSQLERDQVSERTIMAMAHKKQQGQHCGSPAYGFEMVEKKLVKVAKEHEAIALIQQMKADGATLQMIADELNNQGITTKRGAKWQPIQVSRVLGRVA